MGSLTAVFTDVSRLFHNTAATGIAGFVAGFLTKTFGERLFGDFYTKRQLKISVYRELAENYMVISDSLAYNPSYDPDLPYGLNTLPTLLTTTAYDNAVSQVVLYSSLPDKHYLNGCYLRIKTINLGKMQTGEGTAVVCGMIKKSIESPIMGDVKLLKSFLSPKYRQAIKP